MAERRLYLGPLTDNRRWDWVALRASDVVVATPPKSGTTWMQTIVALLASGDPNVVTEPAVRMPWVDIRYREIDEVAARIGAMAGRRCLKSHTPLDGLPVEADAQFICVFRHPLDAHFSYRKHLKNLNMTHVFAHWFPEEDPDGVTFRRFLDGGPEGYDGDAMPLAHILRHYAAARAAGARSNVSLFHYADMSRDLPGTFARVAALMGVSYPADVVKALIAAAGFDHMRANAARYAPGGGTGFMKDDAAFFDSGSSGKWEGKLSTAELAAYDAAMDAALDPEARAWLEFGSA
ncbi:MAG: sulfotransferase domain-containing protein [Pseudomonadota bacterium]